MSIPTQFHRLHPSAPPACRSGRYGSSRCVVPDYRSGLSAPAVHAAFVSIQIQALPFVRAAFLNNLHPVPQEGDAVAWLTVTVQPVFFNPPAEGIVDVAVAFSMVLPFDTHFGQAVLGIVMVILSTTGGLFAADAAMSIVLVFISSKAQ
ncbi:hypothetical protein ACQP6C_12470 [Snodgrassella alvi]|uniref:hypothetical protein n=1 Tax=Snodgrassella alvi TaxID=1196083 RepID=UPI003CFD01F3